MPYGMLGSPQPVPMVNPLAHEFSPRSIAGLVSWWDFGDLTTLRQNSDGTTPATANGDRVAYVADKAGSTNLTQSSNSLCGSLAIPGMNGKNSVVMPSTSGARYDIAAFPGGTASFNTADQTWFLVARYTGANDWCAALNNRAGFFVDVAQNVSANAYSGVSTVPTYRVNGSPIAPTVTRPLLRAVLGLNRPYQLTVSNINPNDTGNGAPGAGGTTYGLGGFGTTLTFIGDFCEFLLYFRNLSAAEIESVERYLKRKWETP